MSTLSCRHPPWDRPSSSLFRPLLPHPDPSLCVAGVLFTPPPRGDSSPSAVGCPHKHLPCVSLSAQRPCSTPLACPQVLAAGAARMRARTRRDLRALVQGLWTLQSRSSSKNNNVHCVKEGKSGASGGGWGLRAPHQGSQEPKDPGVRGDNAQQQAAPWAGCRLPPSHSLCLGHKGPSSQGGSGTACPPHAPGANGWRFWRLARCQAPRKPGSCTPSPESPEPLLWSPATPQNRPPWCEDAQDGPPAPHCQLWDAGGLSGGPQARVEEGRALAVVGLQPPSWGWGGPEGMWAMDGGGGGGAWCSALQVLLQIKATCRRPEGGGGRELLLGPKG